MPPRSSADRGVADRDTKSLKRLAARLDKDNNRIDVYCWEKIEVGLNSVVGHVPCDNTGGLKWTSSAAGQAALECMKAIIEAAPAAMRTVTSSRHDQGGCMGSLVVPHAVCRVLDLCAQQHHVSLLATWPSGIQSCTRALARVAALLPTGALNDPVVASHIFSSADRDDLDLPLPYRVDLILVLVRDAKCNSVKLLAIYLFIWNSLIQTCVCASQSSHMHQSLFVCLSRFSSKSSMAQ
jgi:hypothetical protein